MIENSLSIFNMFSANLPRRYNLDSFRKKKQTNNKTSNWPCSQVYTSSIISSYWTFSNLAPPWGVQTYNHIARGVVDMWDVEDTLNARFVVCWVRLGVIMPQQHRRNEQTEMFKPGCRFPAVLKEITVFFAIVAGSYKQTMFQAWVFTVSEEGEPQSSGRRVIWNFWRRRISALFPSSFCLWLEAIYSTFVFFLHSRKPSPSASQRQTNKKQIAARCSSLVHVSKQTAIFDLICWCHIFNTANLPPLYI